MPASVFYRQLIHHELVTTASSGAAHAPELLPEGIFILSLYQIWSGSRSVYLEQGPSEW
jgi:hypothetical protein